MSQLSFVLVNHATSTSALYAKLTDSWLDSFASAATVQLDRDFAVHYGGSYSVRAGNPGAPVMAGEIAAAIVDSLPQPSAVAYHDVDGQAAPVVFISLSMCQSLDDVSDAGSHEFLETGGDEGCNLYADCGDGTQIAYEVCDPLEASGYTIGGIRVSDFVTRAYFKQNGQGPYSYLESVGGPRILPAPFTIASGGYAIKRDANGNTVQVNGQLRASRHEKLSHWSSRAVRRGALYMP